MDRHCAAATAVAAALRAAADSCAALRDALWRLVGDKVNAAVAIDDRRAEVRPVWLSAAQTVMSGATDRAEATDVVTHQITPYVDADIRTDWLGAMRAATASVAAAYDDALNRLHAYAPAVFDVPGPLDATDARPPAHHRRGDTSTACRHGARGRRRRVACCADGLAYRAGGPRASTCSGRR